MPRKNRGSRSGSQKKRKNTRNDHVFKEKREDQQYYDSEIRIGYEKD